MRPGWSLSACGQSCGSPSSSNGAGQLLGHRSKPAQSAGVRLYKLWEGKPPKSMLPSYMLEAWYGSAYVLLLHSHIVMLLSITALLCLAFGQLNGGPDSTIRVIHDLLAACQTSTVKSVWHLQPCCNVSIMASHWEILKRRMLSLLRTAFSTMSPVWSRMTLMFNRPVSYVQP